MTPEWWAFLLIIGALGVIINVLAYIDEPDGLSLLSILFSLGTVVIATVNLAVLTP